VLRSPAVVTWMRLARAYQQVNRAVAAHLGERGLSVGQFDVLAQVGAREGITQNQLAEALLVTKSNVCQILARMQERGWVYRRQDGRANRLFLTAAGRQLYEEVVPEHEAFVEQRMEVLSVGDLDRLSRILRRLERAELAGTRKEGW
jgi:DNA-binding MarR family transcriptional regulator